MVNFDRRHPLPNGINEAGCGEGRSKRKRENLGRCRPLMARRRLDCRRRLRSENLGTTPQIGRTSRGNDFFVAVSPCHLLLV
ncbi:hypothetical protein BHM03_00003181 [Ensete ventricosum]|nr:hypothetical protein BHM03_00003181 [Ensete ventricosum]